MKELEQIMSMLTERKKELDILQPQKATKSSRELEMTSDDLEMTHMEK